MKKYLMMALAAMILAGCSKDYTETEVPLPTMSDQEIWDAFIGTRWHRDVAYITNYTFAATPYQARYISYKGYVVDKTYYYYDGSMTRDAWFVADKSIHVVRMTIAAGQKVDGYYYPDDHYEEYMTITPHSIKGDTAIVTEVIHKISGIAPDNPEQPETIKLIKGAKPDYDPSGKIQ